MFPEVEDKLSAFTVRQQMIHDEKDGRLDARGQHPCRLDRLRRLTGESGPRQRVREKTAAGGVAVNHQHGAALQRGGKRAGRRRAGQGHGLHRNCEGKHRAAARLALDPNLATHEGTEPLADGETKAGAAIFARGGGVDLREQLEQQLPFFLRDADAGVPHGDLDAAGFGQGGCRTGCGGWHSAGTLVRAGRGHLRRGHLDGDAAAGGEFHGVVQEVDDDLAQPGDVAHNPGRHARVGEVGEVDVLDRRLHGEHVERLLDASGQLEGLPLQLHHARFNLREVEDVLDDGQERIAAGADDVYAVALLGIERGFEEQAGHADDAVHGRADLVAHRGEEFRLGPRGVVGFLLRTAQVILGLHARRDVGEDGDEVLDGAGLVVDGLQVEMEVVTPAVAGVADEVRVERHFPLQSVAQAGDGGRIGVGADQQLREGAADHLGEVESEQADEAVVDPLEVAGGLGDGNEVVGAAGDEGELAGGGLTGAQRLFGAAALLVLGHQPFVDLLGGAAAHMGGAGEIDDDAEQHAQPESQSRDEFGEKLAAAPERDLRRGEADAKALVEEIEDRLLAQARPDGIGGKLLEHPLAVDIDGHRIKGGKMQALLNGLEQDRIEEFPHQYLRIRTVGRRQGRADEETLAAQRQLDEAGKCQFAGGLHLGDELAVQHVLAMVVVEEVLVAFFRENPAGVPGLVDPGQRTQGGEVLPKGCAFTVADVGGELAGLHPARRHALKGLRLVIQLVVEHDGGIVDGELRGGADEARLAVVQGGREQQGEHDACRHHGHRQPARETGGAVGVVAPGTAEQQMPEQDEGQAVQRCGPDVQDPHRGRRQSKEPSDQRLQPDGNDQRGGEGDQPWSQSRQQRPVEPQQAQAGDEECKRGEARHAAGGRRIDRDVHLQEEFVDGQIPSGDILQNRQQAHGGRQHGQPYQTVRLPFQRQQDDADRDQAQRHVGLHRRIIRLKLHERIDPLHPPHQHERAHKDKQRGSEQ